MTGCGCGGSRREPAVQTARRRQSSSTASPPSPRRPSSHDGVPGLGRPYRGPQTPPKP